MLKQNRTLHDLIIQRSCWTWRRMASHLSNKAIKHTMERRPRRPSGSRRSSSRPTFSRRSSSSSSLHVTDLVDTFKDQQGLVDAAFVPTVKAQLDQSLPLDYFKQDIISIVQGLRIPKWHKIQISPKSIERLELKRINGALTNCIFKVSFKNYDPLLLRIYGPNVDSIIDREVELKTLTRLSMNNIGPKLMGCFTNGRFEQYLENSTTLDKELIRDPAISRRIGRRMKDLHTGIPLELNERLAGPVCWNNIEKWLTMVERMADQATLDEQEAVFHTSFKEFKAAVLKYRKWLFDQYEPFEINQALVFCHNDTQYGNLLFYTKKQTEHQELVVIDFEYSGPNLPAYDITNHFCEWMANYHHPTKSYHLNEDKYPTKDERLNFLESYVNYEGLSKSRVTSVEQLHDEIIKWRAANCVFWALWAVISHGSLSEMVSEKVSRFAKETEERGPNGEIYRITVDEASEGEVVGEEVGDNADDNFDSLAYAAQKTGMAMGDFLQFGLIDEAPLAGKPLKTMDCRFIT